MVLRRDGDPTFSIEELLSTKLRALLQRNKGRDLIDLSHSLDIFETLKTKRLVELSEIFGHIWSGDFARAS